MIRLRVVAPELESYVFETERDSVVVGRGEEAELALKDPHLSRQHARIYHENGRIFVEDLASHNGTFVDGRRIGEATEVQPGGSIEVSRIRLVVVGDREEESPLIAEADTSSRTLFRSADEILEDRPKADSDIVDLRRHAERLQLLNEIHAVLARPQELPELIQMILDRVFDHLRPDQAALFLHDDHGELRRAAFKAVPGSPEEPFFSRSLAAEVMVRRLGALVSDAPTDERLSASESIMSSGVRSIAAAPLIGPDDVLGLLVVSSLGGLRQFDQADLELLVSLASVAALHIRNAALAEEAAERRVMAEEVAVARRIQTGLLPSRLPEIPGYDVHAGTLPSRGVSGDYYLVAEREEEGADFCLMVVDVAGKGLSAALLTASCEALATGFIQMGADPKEVCTRVSRRLFRRTPPERFATAFVGMLDPAEGSLRWASAGHDPALLVRASGEAEWLEATGLPLGLMPESEYRMSESTLAAGDLLVIYTDGVTEAANPDGEEFGRDRLRAAVTESRARPCEEIAREVERRLNDFVSGSPFADDRTMLVIRRLP